MPITVGYEFNQDEISQIEGAGLTIADVREFLGNYSANAEGSAEVELDTAIGGALKIKALREEGKEPVLESFIDNEVSDEEARAANGDLNPTGSTETVD